MDITTTQLTTVTITLTGDECRAFLVDPAPAQAQVRAALAPLHSVKNERKSIKLGNRGPKANTKTVQCPHCKRQFAGSGWLAKHVRQMHPTEA